MDHTKDNVELCMVAVWELTEWERQEVVEVRVDDEDHRSRDGKEESRRLVGCLKEPRSRDGEQE